LKKLQLSEWANIAEIIASIVIVFSLAYVGRELNQNTTSIQQTSYQSTLEMLTQGDLLLAANAELDALVRKGETNPEQLNAAEWSRFGRFVLTRFGAWEYMYLAKQENSISDAHWSAFEPYFMAQICGGGFRKYYNENGISFDTTFRQYLDEKISIQCRM